MLRLHFVQCNFICIRKSSETTPTIAAGVAEMVHDFEWIADGIDARVPNPIRPRTCKSRTMISN